MGFRAAFRALISKDETISKENTPTSRGKQPNAHELDDEDRVLSTHIRQMKAEARRIEAEMHVLRQRKQLQDLKDELTDFYDDEESPQSDGDIAQILALLAPILSKVPQNQGGQQQSLSEFYPTPTQNNQIHSSMTAPPQNPQQIRQFRDEDLREMIGSQSKLKILIAKKMNKEELKNKIREQMPVTDADFERAHQILLEEF